jgi:hypothetical protein
MLHGWMVRLIGNSLIIRLIHTSFSFLVLVFCAFFVYFLMVFTYFNFDERGWVCFYGCCGFVFVKFSLTLLELAPITFISM